MSKYLFVLSMLVGCASCPFDAELEEMEVRASDGAERVCFKLDCKIKKCVEME